MLTRGVYSGVVTPNMAGPLDGEYVATNASASFTGEMGPLRNPDLGGSGLEASCTWGAALE
jgi:hypothetical protein